MLALPSLVKISPLVFLVFTSALAFADTERAVRLIGLRAAERNVHAGVGHGFGFRDAMKGPVAGWPDRFAEWLDGRGFLAKK